MRLYRAQIPRIAQEIITSLRADKDIEVEDAQVPEAEKDVLAVMDQYLKTDQKIVEQAKDIVDQRRLTHSELGKIKRELCERYEHPTGDEGVRWMIGQIVEGFMISNHIEEVYAEDQMLRRKIHEIFKRHIVDEAQLDREVRDRIKNLQEGTSAWNIQYQKVMREIRRKHGLGT